VPIIGVHIRSSSPVHLEEGMDGNKNDVKGLKAKRTGQAISS
jgi:hypothetical protein